MSRPHEQDQDPWSPEAHKPCTPAQMKKWVEAMVRRDNRHDRYLVDGEDE